MNKLKITETDIKKQIKDYLDVIGAFHFHILQGLGCYAGNPDMIAILKDGTVLFIEIKTEKGKLSDNQIEFSRNIYINKANYLVVRGYEDIENFIKQIKKGE